MIGRGGRLSSVVWWSSTDFFEFKCHLLDSYPEEAGSVMGFLGLYLICQVSSKFQFTFSQYITRTNMAGECKLLGRGGVASIEAQPWKNDANKTYFHKTDFSLSLVLKVRVFGTLKEPIGLLVRKFGKHPQNLILWVWLDLFFPKRAKFSRLLYLFGSDLINNYSWSPKGLRVNSPWGRRPNGLLTQRPWGREE